MSRRFDWNDEKNEKLRKHRGISFEDIVRHISSGDLLAIRRHPNQTKYPGQQIFLVRVDDYVYVVPFVENEGVTFLKTVIPSRKATRELLREASDAR